MSPESPSSDSDSDSSPPVTQRHIANLLGLNIATVSRALQNSPRVAPATRRRVQNAAIELGYVPDPVLSRLVNRRWANKRALASSWAFLTHRQNLHLQPYIMGALETSRILGFSLDVYRLEEFPDHSRLNRLLLARGVEGIILGAMGEEGITPVLDWSRFSTVICGDPVISKPFHRIRPNTYAAAHLAVRNALSSGYGRLGLIHYPLFLENDWRRLAGYRNALSQAGIEPLPTYTQTPAENTISRDKIRQWIVRLRIDCVITSSHRHADWLFREESCPVVLLSHNEHISPLTGCRLNLKDVGIAAAHQLAAQIQLNRRGIPDTEIQTLVGPVWCEGNSLPKCSHPA